MKGRWYGNVLPHNEMKGTDYSAGKVQLESPLRGPRPQLTHLADRLSEERPNV